MTVAGSGWIRKEPARTGSSPRPPDARSTARFNPIPCTTPRQSPQRQCRLKSTRGADAPLRVGRV